MLLVKEKISQGARVVDVRSPMEFAGGQFPGAINIPLQELQARLPELGAREEPIVVYCASGSRSSMARMFLNQAGYRDVINGGGISSMMSVAQSMN